MRLFVAVDPPSDERARLLDWLASGNLDSARLRLTPSEQWHLTLTFFGETPAVVVPELAERLQRAAQRSPELSLQLTGTGSFPADPARARVLWVGVDGHTAELSRLAERANAAGRRVGLDLEVRKYRAHLTIARPRQGPIDLTETLASLPPYVGEPWRATTIRLVRSHLGPPVRHELLEEFPLG
ncbi:MAG TPA: RNA 2',3'-cyclic phosphodiesterase [Mycobacteriales bacterium]|nr:RNA 2',3'-cyclic phosphodiesterase [Mycobacteriales bacterium]